MLRVEFEPTTPVFERAKTVQASYRTATAIETIKFKTEKLSKYQFEYYSAIYSYVSQVVSWLEHFR
jgi:hypothetical protein